MTQYIVENHGLQRVFPGLEKFSPDLKVIHAHSHGKKGKIVTLKEGEFKEVKTTLALKRISIKEYSKKEEKKQSEVEELTAKVQEAIDKVADTSKKTEHQASLEKAGDDMKALGKLLGAVVKEIK